MVVDYHHHAIPPEYVREVGKMGVTGNTGISFPDWDPLKNIKKMDRVGIDKAMLSISTPGVHFGDDALAGLLSRICNDYIAGCREKYPERYGALGILPYPDIEGSLKEMEYIYDVLKMDGLGLLSNTASGIYFGAPGFDELFQELNRRNALVFIHPEDFVIHKGRYMPVTIMYDRCLSTARSGAALFMNDYLEKYPDIRFVLAHGGGGLAVMARKLVREYFAVRGIAADAALTEEKMNLIRGMYYDTAQRGPTVYSGLKALCGAGHVVFGSDMPYNSAIQLKPAQKAFADFEGFTDAEKERIHAGSGLKGEAV